MEAGTDEGKGCEPPKRVTRWGFTLLQVAVWPDVANFLEPNFKINLPFHRRRLLSVALRSHFL